MIREDANATLSWAVSTDGSEFKIRWGKIALERKKPNQAEFEKLAWLIQDVGEIRCPRLLKCFTSIKN